MKISKSKFSVMDDRYQVNAISTIPDNPVAFMVLGHGAGAGMEHKFMSTLAHNLAAVQIGSLRYNFPYIEHLYQLERNIHGRPNHLWYRGAHW